MANPDVVKQDVTTARGGTLIVVVQQQLAHITLRSQTLGIV